MIYSGKFFGMSHPSPLPCLMGPPPTAAASPTGPERGGHHRPEPARRSEGRERGREGDDCERMCATRGSEETLTLRLIYSRRYIGLRWALWAPRWAWSINRGGHIYDNRLF